MAVAPDQERTLPPSSTAPSRASTLPISSSHRGFPATPCTAPSLSGSLFLRSWWQPARTPFEIQGFSLRNLHQPALRIGHGYIAALPQSVLVEPATKLPRVLVTCRRQTGQARRLLISSCLAAVVFMCRITYIDLASRCVAGCGTSRAPC